MIGRFFDPSELLRAYRDPLAWISLGVDLMPVIAVLAFGWGATPLVALYWLENLVIGAFTLLRMLASALTSGAKAAMVLFMAPFFTVHYGMFCYGHGVFLYAFANAGSAAAGMPGPFGLAHWALATAPELLWFVAAIGAVSVLYFAIDFVGRGEVRTANPGTEMFSPYGRIVTLHVAIILGAGLAFALDQPLLGVLLLILIRVAFGVVLTVLRRRRRDGRISGEDTRALAAAAP
jgi:Family of unknown function (DUF6498)